MNDLRLLHQVDPAKKIITLQFKQISALEPLMPLLRKFQNLESLSLHGNRLKALPEDMSQLENLQELDISNNMFTNLNEITKALKTLPNLTHLMINFKSQQEESMVKNQLPRLQRINKKAISTFKSDYTYSNKNKKNTKQLTEQDLQNVAVLYDQIRNVYRDSKYMVDKELADDFDRNVDNIMLELTDKNKSAESLTEKNCNTLCGKFALVDLCFVKLITYFYHFDKKIASALEKIHDNQADMFKNITDMVIEETMRSKIEIVNVRTKKEELYKAEIRRLKNFQNQASKQLEYLQNKNREMLNKLIKFTKTDVMESTIGRAVSLSKSSAKRGRSVSDRENNQKINVRNKIKHLTPHQLKEMMAEIYQSKRRHNRACYENGLPMETMETHMYTYLNQKYGLKSLAVQWAMHIVNAIRAHGMDDPEISTFGKILRNQLDQYFAEQQDKVKESLQEGIKKFRKNLANVPNEEITANQAEEVLLCMGLRRDQISVIISRIRDDKLVNNLMSVENFEKSLLDYYMTKHDEKTYNFYQQFKAVDSDEDGILNSLELQILMNKVEKNVDASELVKLVDPSSRGVIIYSNLLQILLRAPEFKNYFKGTEM